MGCEEEQERDGEDELFRVLVNSMRVSPVAIMGRVIMWCAGV